MGRAAFEEVSSAGFVLPIPRPAYDEVGGVGDLLLSSLGSRKERRGEEDTP